tara:strand:- start:702 stop:1208 length:507 start_codon:yes stop_codon:yes gene_type:complete
MTTVTRINDNTLSVIIHDGATPTIVERNSRASKLIDFNAPDVQQHFWDLMMAMATDSIDPMAPIGPKRIESELLSNRLDALEARLDRMGDAVDTIGVDQSEHDERITARENADKCNDTAQQHLRELIRNLESRVGNLATTCSVDYRDHENRIDDLETAARKVRDALSF